MPWAWTCIEHPASHGHFPQAALDHLAAIAPKMQPRNRYGCPKCIAFDKPGWMRPTFSEETGGLCHVSV